MEEFLIAISLIIDSAFFTFNKKYYKQIFNITNTPMGFPLLSILANIAGYRKGCSESFIR